MSYDNFQFEAARRKNIYDMLMRQKPRPDDDRAEHFLTECEREISDWARCWPNSAPLRQGDAIALDRVADAARSLLGEIRKLPAGPRQMLAIAILQGDRHGIDIDKINDTIPGIENQIVDLLSAATNCHSELDGQITKRPAEDFCYRIAITYIASFRKMPPTNQVAIFPRVLREISENCIPGRSFIVGRRIQEAAVARACWHFDMNK